MAWTVVSPRLATSNETKVVRVTIPHFPDHIDYEDILGRAFDKPSDRDWLASGGVIILATPVGYEAVERLMGSDAVNVTERAVWDETTKLALERQIVALRYVT